MREAFSDTLIQLARNDPNVLLLTGDHGYSLFETFKNECPNQFINAGIAEQNMVGVAAGLAKLGFRPFVYGLAAFVPIRTIEQIKLDIALSRLPVVLLGDGAGFVYSYFGTSHHSTEDIACTRSIPGLQVLSPCDKFEMSACMHYAYRSEQPTYLRIGKDHIGAIQSGSIELNSVGVLFKVRDGRRDHVGLIATGSMVQTAVKIAEILDLSVWTAPSIKPLSVEDVQIAAMNCSAIVTLEEHSIFGGLGTAVAEIIAEHALKRVLRIGVSDRFSERCGSYDYLLTEQGLDYESVKKRIQSFALRVTEAA
jgi:transketolase